MKRQLAVFALLSIAGLSSTAQVVAQDLPEVAVNSPQETLRETQPELKPELKAEPEQKPEEKLGQEPEQKTEQKTELEPGQEPEKTLEQTPVTVNEFNTAPAVMAQINAVNRQILLKEIELERLSINFRQAHNVQGRWRGWRYFLSQEADATLTTSGLIDQLVERERILHHPNIWTLNNGKPRLSINTTRASVLEGGFTPQILGQSLSALGAGLEFSINMYHKHQASKNGMSPQESIARALSIKKDFGELFQKRKLLLDSAQFTGNDATKAQLEGRVLEDIANYGLHEYASFHYQARRFMSFQNSLYVLDFTKKLLGISGNIVADCSLHQKRPHLVGTAGVLTLGSGALIMTTPILARGYGIVKGQAVKRELKAIASDCPQPNFSQLKRDCLDLARQTAKSGELSASPDKALSLLACYEEHLTQRSHQLALADRELQAGTRTAQENILGGIIIGGGKSALGILSMVAGWHYPRFPHRSNHLLYGGTLTYTVASAYAMGDNLRIRLQDEWNRHKLGSRGLLPGQIFNQRLASLAKLESDLKAKK